jgi:hemoglobin
MENAEVSVYELVGGETTFVHLVQVFYDRIAQDPVLRPMFPADLEAGKRWQKLFLVQFFGGPSDYAEERGHPRLRMRHQPFVIDQTARDHWLHHMLGAMQEVGIVEPAYGIMRDYFKRASTFMINSHPTTDNLLQWRSEGGKNA